MSIIHLIFYFPNLINNKWKEFLLLLGLKVVDITEVMRIELLPILFRQKEERHYATEINTCGSVPTNIMLYNKNKAPEIYPNELEDLSIALVILALTIFMGYLTYLMKKDHKSINIENYDFEAIVKEIEYYKGLIELENKHDELRTYKRPDYLSDYNQQEEGSNYKPPNNEEFIEKNLVVYKEKEEPKMNGTVMETSVIYEGIENLFKTMLMGLMNSGLRYCDQIPNMETIPNVFEYNADFRYNRIMLEKIKCFPIEVKLFEKNCQYDIKMNDTLFGTETLDDLNKKLSLTKSSARKRQLADENNDYNNQKTINQEAYHETKPESLKVIVKERQSKDKEIPLVILTLKNDTRYLLTNNFVVWEKVLYPNESSRIIKLDDLEILLKDYAASESLGKLIIQLEILQLFNTDSRSNELIHKIRFLLSTDFRPHNTLMIEIVQIYRLCLEQYLLKLIELISEERLEFSQSLLLLIRDFLTYKNPLKISLHDFKEYLRGLLNHVNNNEALNDSLSSCITSAIISIDYELLSQTFFGLFNDIFSTKSNINQQIIFMKGIKYYICFNRSLIISELAENPNANKIKTSGYLLIQLFAKNIDNGIESARRESNKKRFNARKNKCAIVKNPLMLEIVELYLVFIEIILNDDKVPTPIQYEMLTNFLSPIYSKLKNALEYTNYCLEPPILKELQVNIHLK